MQGLTFGQVFANQIRRKLLATGDNWHLDGVVIAIFGVEHWLWRAVDQNGMVLDILVQSRRDTRAANRLLRKLIKQQCRAPRVMGDRAGPAGCRLRRKCWRVWQRFMDSSAIVFLDETGATTNMVRRYGWAPKDECLVDATPHGHWHTTTFVAGLRSTGIIAPLVLDGPMTGETFQTYVAQFLAP